MATVIRVKRKKTERPAEALLVVSRATKKSDSNHGTRRIIESLPDTRKTIFHYATTVKSKSPMNDELKEKVRNAILVQQKRHVIKERSKQFLNKNKSLALLKKKLKSVTANHLPGSEKTGFAHLSTKCSPYSCSSSSARVINASPATPLKNETAHPEHLQKQMLQPPFQPVIESQIRDRFTKIVPCFAERRLEQVRQRTASDTQPGKAEEEHVYDLYYCQKTKEWNVKDVLYVKPCKCENVLAVKSPTSKYEKQETKKHHKPKTSAHISSRFLYRDDDSIDEDERRFIFDEEEDLNDSDEYDVTGRVDDVESYFGGGYSDYDCDAPFNDDNLATELAAFEQDYDYNNDDYTPNDPHQ